VEPILRLLTADDTSDAMALKEAAGWNQLEGTVAHSVFLGELTEIALTLADGTRLLARGSDLPKVPPGETLTLSWPVEATALLDP